MEKQIILEAKNITYSYDDGMTNSLDDVSLQIEKGKKVAFMGANGSGKSTFFLCCNGILKPQSGTLYLDETEVDYSKKGLLNLRSKVGIVFQDPDNQLFSASVYQEISFGILNLGVPVDEAKKEVEHVIAEMEIEPFRNQPVHALSGGQKKQVAIADILVMHPEIIILDEPVAALDPRHTRLVNQMIDKLTAEGITVLMATHDMDYAYAWADEIVLMHEGNVLKQGSPTEVCTDREALEKTNLEMPTVLRMYERLCECGVIEPIDHQPRTMKELEELLKR